tara:strand:+ start:5873 stop:6151 length:279 start_codon:yes stop_codon:yes gene_type:complete
MTTKPIIAVTGTRESFLYFVQMNLTQLTKLSKAALYAETRTFKYVYISAPYRAKGLYIADHIHLGPNELHEDLKNEITACIVFSPKLAFKGR